jgi:asparagine synthetase B (glutamine-hydrolysing)
MLVSPESKLSSLPNLRRASVVLSGGLDSSIVAQLGKDGLGLKAAITVLATPGAADRPHAAAVAAAAGLKHHCVETTLPELLEGELRTCVEALHCFDPTVLRSNMAVCRALREAAALGYTSAATGDAADELFGEKNSCPNGGHCHQWQLICNTCRDLRIGPPPHLSCSQRALGCCISCRWVRIYQCVG